MSDENKTKVVEDVNLAEKVVEANQELAAMKALLEAEEIKRKQAEAALVNFRPAPKQEELKHPREYAQELVKAKDMTNKEFWETSLNYRQASLDKFGRDVWSDTGKPTSDTEYIAKSVRALIDESATDAEFRMKLNLRLEDDKNIAMILAKREQEARRANK